MGNISQLKFIFYMNSAPSNEPPIQNTNKWKTSSENLTKKSLTLKILEIHFAGRWVENAENTGEFGESESTVRESSLPRSQLKIREDSRQKSGRDGRDDGRFCRDSAEIHGRDRPFLEDFCEIIQPRSRPNL